MNETLKKTRNSYVAEDCTVHNAYCHLNIRSLSIKIIENGTIFESLQCVRCPIFTFYSNYDRTPGEEKGGRRRRGKGRGREGRRSQPPPNKIMMMMKQGLDAICLKVVLYSVVISKVL